MTCRNGPAARFRRLLLLVVCVASLSVAGCRIEGAPTDDAAQLSLVAPVFPPPQGKGQLAVRLTDDQGHPIDTAVLQIRGDMGDTGMIPFLITAEKGESGIYRVPVEWTMAGDWFVTVEATLDDGRIAGRTFEMTVTGEETLCTDAK